MLIFIENAIKRIYYIFMKTHNTSHNKISKSKIAKNKISRNGKERNPKDGSKNFFPALFHLIPLLVLIVIYIIFRNTYSPVLNEEMLDELAFVKYLVAHDSHTFADGWVSSKPFFPLSTRYFLTFYYTRFAFWKDALLNSITCVYAIYTICYMFLVTSLHARKFYTYIIASVPGALIAILGLKASCDCNYLLSVVCLPIICLSFIIHGIRFRLPVPARIAVSSLALIPIACTFFYMNGIKKEYSFDNSSLLSFSKADETDGSKRYLGLIDFMKNNDIPVSYCTDSILTQVDLISDSSVSLSPVISIDDLTPVTKESDSIANPYDEVNRDSKPFYMIYDTETVAKNSSSLSLRFGENIYSDEYYSVYRYNNFTYFADPVFQNNMLRLANEKYDSFYYSFLGSHINDPKDFPVFSGTNPIFIEPSSKDYENINVLIDSAISKKGIKNVFLEIDPIELMSDPGKEEFDHLNKMIEKYPDVLFYATLAYPEIDYWKSFNEEERNKHLTDYVKCVEKLSHNDNLKIFMPAAEKWLVESKNNYVDNVPAEEIAYNLLVTTVCNVKYPTDNKTIASYCEELNKLIKEDMQYPDISDKEIVFIGDSIFGNYTEPLSIPGIVSGLGDCRTYNLGISGSTTMGDFNNIVDFFISGETKKPIENERFQNDYNDFMQNHDPSKELIFVINYGLNDYFIGIPAGASDSLPYGEYEYDSYESALKAGIDKLKNAYPDCKICILSPIYTNYFDSGKEIKGENGAPLETYRQIGAKLSDEPGIMRIDSAALIPINEKNHTTYLIDGVHPTPDGLYLIADAIVRYIGTEKTKE